MAGRIIKAAREGGTSRSRSRKPDISGIEHRLTSTVHLPDDFHPRVPLLILSLEYMILPTRSQSLLERALTKYLADGEFDPGQREREDMEQLLHLLKGWNLYWPCDGWDKESDPNRDHEDAT